MRCSTCHIGGARFGIIVVVVTEPPACRKTTTVIKALSWKITAVEGLLLVCVDVVAAVVVSPPFFAKKLSKSSCRGLK